MVDLKTPRQVTVVVCGLCRPPDALLLEPSLNDGEVVIEVTRSPKLVDMMHKVIHEASGPVGKSCKICDASVKIPRGATVAEDFKYAIAKNQ